MKPEHIITTATVLEMLAVIEGLGLDAPPPKPTPGASRLVHIKGRQAMLTITGVGPLAAALTAGRLIGEGALGKATCSGLLCLGIAGSYTPLRAPMGSIAIATQEIWPEYGLVTDDGIDAVALGFPLFGSQKGPKTPVWNCIDLTPQASLDGMGLFSPAASPRIPENPLVVSGPSITAAGVSGTRQRAEQLASRHSALTENMEGFPLALAALQQEIPFVEVRAISNIVGDRSVQGWNIPAALAALSRATALIFA